MTAYNFHFGTCYLARRVPTAGPPLLLLEDGLHEARVRRLPLLIELGDLLALDLGGD